MSRHPAPRPFLTRLSNARRAAVAAAALSLAVPAAAQAPVPQGPEFRVNTTTTSNQQRPSVAMAAAGAFVVTWIGADGSSRGISAQRYDAAGTPQGSEFRANTYTTCVQRSPSVAMAADGAFVVVWESAVDQSCGGAPGQDGSLGGIYAQRYDAAGVRQGGEFRVNTETAGDQQSASVATAADGAFVVVWESEDGSDLGVYAQRYDASGAARGGEFRVNTYTMGLQIGPSAAMDADGAFVVAWESRGQDGDLGGIYAQRYDAAGVPVGPEFQVNTVTTGFQVVPSAAMDADGAFVVAWYADDGSSVGIYARRYTAGGVPAGPEFGVNTTTFARQIYPSVSVADDGDFTVVWQSDQQDGSGPGVYAQQYSAAGAAQGGEFLVNTVTRADQLDPAVAADSEGDFVVVWESNGQRADALLGVYAQRYSPAPVAAEPGALSGLALSVAPSPVGPGGGHVRYDLPEALRVRLTVTDVLGRVVAVLVDDERSAGPHAVALDAARLAPGVYVVRLVAGGGPAVVRRVTVAR